jgi:fructuronate reductase
MTPPRLTQQSLATLAPAIGWPSYPRGDAVGVVHLGLGAFHRAHQALVFDALLQGGDARWGVCGVAMRSPVLKAVLDSQDGLYAVQTASSAGATWRISGSIWQTCHAQTERGKVVEALAAPHTRWVTLTVTEKGYTPELATLLAEGLAARRAGGLVGLTIASCDNLSHNGDKLKALCLGAAKDHESLPAWINTHCAFPNSMVDRIVPAASAKTLANAEAALGATDSAALATESFWEWVIERKFCDPADAEVLASAGVAVVEDVSPFEEAKLRMLNASHTAMACIGAVAGLGVISDCIGNAQIQTFVRGLMTEEVGPQMRRADWPAYRDALLARFTNPALQHSVHQIATDSSQKIPQRLPPSVLGAISKGLPFQRLAFAAAAWMRYLQGMDERGTAYALNDPMAERLQALVLANVGDAVATAQAIGALTEVWGSELRRHSVWLAAVARWLGLIQQQGMLAALAQVNGEAEVASI